MDSDLAVTMAAMNTAKTQGGMQIAMIKQQVQQDASVVNMIEQALRMAPPPPGQGTQVDKIA